MKTNKFKLLTSLLFVFGLSSCNVLIKVPVTSSSNTNTNTTSSDTTPTEVPVTSLEVNPDVLALAIGETSVVEARCLPEGSNQKVTWKSSKMNVATVDPETGVITAVATGTTKIYATSVANTRVTGYCTLTVAEQIVRATNVSLDKHELSLSLNGTTYLHGTITPTNATGGINWSSSNESVVTVSSSGKLTAVGYGTATIRAVAASNNNVYDECAVTVEKISVSSVSLDKTALTVSTGSQTTLTATVLPSNADDKTVKWSSSNTSVAYVDQTGLVRANKEGTAVITVTSNDKPSISASCTFTVQDVHPTALVMSKTKISMSVDSATPIEVSFVPEDVSNKKVTWATTDSSVATVGDISGTTATIYSNALGKCNITATSEDGGLVATAEVTVTTLGKTANKYNYEDLTDHSIYAIDAIPSKGNPKMIVVPVYLSDSANYVPESRKASVRADIEKAYFGTNEETGWRSVKTYYEEESFGRLHLDGVVTDWYNYNLSSKNVGQDQTTQIVSSVASWFKQNNPSTYKDYDTNGDGYLDAIVLIYAAPDYSTSGSSNDNLWAYCYWMQQNPGTATNPVPNVFFWASYDFMYSRSDTNSGGYGGGDTSHCNIDTHTFIHEMGHIFGLNDYYDYNKGYSASGGFSMQDYNVGGHDPFSKMALDWIEPYVPTDT
ncbi:MAG: Ig-like domain-containing protein, partial [Bacilli bacterium]|nr:Ig-like domain-containing protein [Bacilli bacterium]